MGLLIIKNLTIIAHSQHSNQRGNILTQILGIIIYIQYLSLLLPSHGWGLWTYTEGYLKFTSRVAEYFTITPFFEFQDNFIYYPVTIISLIIIVSLFIILCFIDLCPQDKNHNIKFSQARTTILCGSFLFSIQTLQIPCNKFYIQQILNSYQQEHYTQLIVNSITLIFYCIGIFSGEYFLRQYSFLPYHPLQSKFTKLRVSQLIGNITCITLILQNHSQIMNLLALAIVQMIFIFKMINHLYFKPEIPKKNILHFRLSFTLELIAIIVTINIITKNQFFKSKQIIVFMMFISSFGFVLGEQLFITLYKLNLDNQFVYLYQLYELYDLLSNINETSITINHLKLYQLSKSQVFLQGLLMERKKYQMKKYYRFGMRLMKSAFNEIQNKKRSDQEELKLQYISFLSQICQKPLMAYVELKKFIQSSIIKSYYFLFMQDTIDQFLQEKNYIVQKQYEDDKINLQFKEKGGQLDINEIYQFFYLTEQLSIKINEEIKIKQSIWHIQITGSKSIYNLEEASIPLGKKIIECIQLLKVNNINIFNKSYIKECNNLLTLKIISLFQSIVMNDFINSLKCEQRIQEVTKQEELIEIQILKKNNILSDQTILVIISGVKNIGQIINKNKKHLASFFGFNLEDFEQITNINYLMPSYFGIVHNQLLLNYISKGKTNLAFETNIVFGQGENRFIIPQFINVQNNYQFDLDDLCLVGCLSKLTDSKNYLIFDEFGQLIGITEELCNILIKPESINLFMENINQFYIYMFLPMIHIYMQDIQSINSKQEVSISQKQVLIYSFKNINDVLKIHSQIFSKLETTNKVRSLSQFDQYTQAISIVTKPSDVPILESLADTKRHFKQKKATRFQSITSIGKIPNQPNDVVEFLSEIELISQKTQYLGNMKIWLQTQGEKKKIQKYFVLELQDIVEKPLDENEPKLKRKESSRKKLVMGYQQKSFRMSNKQINKKQDSIELPLASPLDSVKIQGQSLLDSSIINNQIVHYVSSRQVNLMGMQKSESLSDEFGSVDNDPLRKWQKQNEFKSTHGLAQKSTSSKRSGNSGYDALNIVNDFTKQQNLSLNLLALIIMKFIILIVFIIFLVINLTSIVGFNQDSQQFISDINLPITLNKYFLNIFSLTWIQQLQTFQILFLSEYLTLRIQNHLLKYSTVFNNMTSLYGNFINLEQQGFLNDLNYYTDQLNEEKLQYTTYIDQLQEIAYQLLNDNDSKIKCNNLLRYRINFQNILQNNLELITSLNNLYNTQQQQKETYILSITILEICLTVTLLMFQIYFWRKVELYCQQIILLSCKLSEQMADEQIYKYQKICDILSDINDQIGWKKQNYHKLCFIDNFKVNQKIKSTPSCQSTKAKQNYNKKKQFSIPLNSRIQNNNTNSIGTLIGILLWSILMSLLYLGDYIMVIVQTTRLNPTQQLASQFIEFALEFDNSIMMSFLIKTEQQFFIQAQQLIPIMFSIDEFLINNNTINLLLDTYSFDHTNLNSIYKSTINSYIISGSDENYMETLYSGSFCDIFSIDEINFCDVISSTQEFQFLYGNYNSSDNNTDYLSRGIIGIVNQFDMLLYQQYDYELSLLKLNDNYTKIDSFLMSQQFDNIILEHFLDTYLGFQTYIFKLQQCIMSLIISQTNNVYILQFTYGISVLVLFIFLSTYLILKSYLRLIHLRLLITLLPVELLLDIYTVSILRMLK